jgi:hypothetical protein
MITSVEFLRQFLRKTIKAVPAVKYALAISVIAAMIAIIYSAFDIDPRLAIIGVIVMLVLMGVMSIFARISVIATKALALLALVFAWFALLLFMAVGLALFTSVFFQWPLDHTDLADLADWQTSKKTQSVKLWSCAWGPAQDAAMEVPCNRNAPDHFHFAVNDPNFCMFMKMDSHLSSGEQLVKGPILLKYLGARPGAKYPGRPPAVYSAQAISGTVIRVFTTIHFFSAKW